MNRRSFLRHLLAVGAVVVAQRLPLPSLPVPVAAKTFVRDWGPEFGIIGPNTGKLLSRVVFPAMTLNADDSLHVTYDLTFE